METIVGFFLVVWRVHAGLAIWIHNAFGRRAFKNHNGALASPESLYPPIELWIWYIFVIWRPPISLCAFSLINAVELVHSERRSGWIKLIIVIIASSGARCTSAKCRFHWVMSSADRRTWYGNLMMFGRDEQRIVGGYAYRLSICMCFSAST